MGTLQPSVRVVIADNDLLFLAGLRSMLSGIPDVEIVGEATTGVEAVRVTRRLMPDLVLLETEMPMLNGIKVTRSILENCPSAAILVLTRAEQSETVIAALRAGARGYLLKDSDVDDILRALETLRSGGAIFGARVAPQVIDFLTRPRVVDTPFPELTHREREILEFVVDGKTNQEIAVKLELSMKTVRNYLSRIIVKLRVADRGEAARLARREGLGTGNAWPGERILAWERYVPSRGARPMAARRYAKAPDGEPVALGAGAT